MVLSLAGIPATRGFLGKFYVLAAGASAAQWSLVIILGLTSTIGLFYYLRILVVLYSEAPERETPTQPVVPASGLVLAVLSALLVWFGLYPAPLQDMIQRNGVLAVAESPAPELDKLSQHIRSGAAAARSDLY
jgi:NADH-quinone oxidoreductase subunit N